MLLLSLIIPLVTFVLAHGETIRAYHGVTADQHQANFNNFSASGYRIISLSVYGNPDDARYAAVWIQQSGPTWVAVHGINSAAYQTYINTWAGKGYIPTLISATGTVDNAIFAAVLEQVSNSSWKARHNLRLGSETTTGTIQYENLQARNQNMIIKSVMIYGTSNDRRYGAVWRSNPENTTWHVHYADNSDSYQAAFNSETQSQFRPTYVTLSEDQTYFSVFKNINVGPWYARHGLTSEQYQTEFDTQLARDFYPVNVQGGGTGVNTRYAVIFDQGDYKGAL